MKNGKLVIFEGIDGSGKSSQYRRICDRLLADGIGFRQIVFPRYEKERVLYAFLRRDVINWDNVQDFRDASIKNIKDRSLSSDKIQEYKDNPKAFLQDKYQFINVQDFKNIINRIEEFYSKNISEFK